MRACRSAVALKDRRSFASLKASPSMSANGRGSARRSSFRATVLRRRTFKTQGRLTDYKAVRCPRTARYRAWQLQVTVETPDEQRAVAFDRTDLRIGPSKLPRHACAREG